MAAVASSDGRVTLLRLFCGQLGGDEGMGNNDHLDSWGLDVHSEFLHMHRLTRSGPGKEWKFPANKSELNLLLHFFPSPNPIRLSCNAVACSRHLLASAGADGRIVVFDLEAGRHVRTYDKADSCSLNSVLFVQQDEVCKLVASKKKFESRSRSKHIIHPLGCIGQHEGPTEAVGSEVKG